MIPFNYLTSNEYESIRRTWPRRMQKRGDEIEEAQDTAEVFEEGLHEVPTLAEHVQELDCVLRKNS